MFNSRLKYIEIKNKTNYLKNIWLIIEIKMNNWSIQSFERDILIERDESDQKAERESL